MRLISLRDITSIKPFDCGDADLNEFLLADAKFTKSSIWHIHMY